MSMRIHSRGEYARIPRQRSSIASAARLRVPQGPAGLRTCYKDVVACQAPRDGPPAEQTCAAYARRSRHAPPRRDPRSLTERGLRGATEPQQSTPLREPSRRNGVETAGRVSETAGEAPEQSRLQGAKQGRRASEPGASRKRPARQPGTRRRGGEPADAGQLNTAAPPGPPVHGRGPQRTTRKPQKPGGPANSRARLVYPPGVQPLFVCLFVCLFIVFIPLGSNSCFAPAAALDEATHNAIEPTGAPHVARLLVAMSLNARTLLGPDPFAEFATSWRSDSRADSTGPGVSWQIKGQVHTGSRARMSSQGRFLDEMRRPPRACVSRPAICAHP